MCKKSQSTFVQKSAAVEIWKMFMWSRQQMLRVVPMYFNLLSVLRHREVCTLTKIPSLAWNSSQAFSPCCCNTSISLTRTEYTQVFRHSHSYASQWLIISQQALISGHGLNGTLYSFEWVLYLVKLVTLFLTLCILHFSTFYTVIYREKNRLAWYLYLWSFEGNLQNYCEFLWWGLANKKSVPSNLM